MKRISLLLVLALVLCTSCKAKERSTINYGASTKPIQFAFDAFDTQCSISIFGIDNELLAEKFSDDIKRLIMNYDEVFSKTKETSEIYEINHRTSNSVMISDQTANIFELGKDFYNWSRNKFDISGGTLYNLWDVKNRTTLPTIEEINDARKHCANFSYVIERNVLPEDVQRRNRITFTGDELTQYDFGALIKGYCSDAIRDMMNENPFIVASIINLGGNVLCTGEITDRKNGAFHVGIFKPFSKNETIYTVDIKDKNVITSGNYQRYFKVEGDDRIYHHIIDPTTGYPTNNGLDSVTIVSDNGLLGDYLSTACMLMGEADSKALIDFAINNFNDKSLQAIYVYSDGSLTKYPENVNFLNK